jgi:hypothetical protein
MTIARTDLAQANCYDTTLLLLLSVLFACRHVVHRSCDTSMFIYLKEKLSCQSVIHSRSLSMSTILMITTWEQCRFV